MTLIFQSDATATEPLSPPDRPRVWYQALFKYAKPPKQRLTPEEALAVISANWSRSWQDIKQNGVDI